MSAVVAPAPVAFRTGLTPTTATGSEFDVGEGETARSGGRWNRKEPAVLLGVAEKGTKKLEAVWSTGRR